MLDCSQRVVTEIRIQILLLNSLVQMHLNVFYQWFLAASEIYRGAHSGCAWAHTGLILHIIFHHRME